MKKIFPVIICLCLIVISLSVAYYFVVFLPRKENMQKIYNLELRKLQMQNANIQNTLDDIQNNNSQPGVSSEDVQNTVQETLDQELQKQANCEGLGGKYQGGGSCAYY